MARARDRSSAAAAAAVDAVEPLEAAYRRLQPGLVRLAHLLTGCSETAQDVVQDVFVATARRWSTLDSADAYLRTAVVNGSMTVHRKSRNERHKVTRLGGMAPVVTLDVPQLDETWDALRQLPERQRAALVLRFYEDLPEAEIARVLGCRPGTVKSLIHRGLAQTRKALR